MKDYNFVTVDDLKRRFTDIEIANGVMEKFDIRVIGHFNNAICLETPVVYNGNLFVNLFYGYSVGSCCGKLIKMIFDLFDIYEEDGINLSDLKKIPLRVVFNKDKVIGIGNFMKDKFFVMEDFFKN